MKDVMPATEMPQTKDGRPVDMTRQDAQSQYVAQVGGVEACVAQLRLDGSDVAFTHTFTRDGFEGQGVASALIAWALDDVRRRGESAVAICPFVRSYVERHADRYASYVRVSS